MERGPEGGEEIFVAADLSLKRGVTRKKNWICGFGQGKRFGEP